MIYSQNLKQVIDTTQNLKQVIDTTETIYFLLTKRFDNDFTL